MAKMKNESGSGKLDYGHNNPSGGTDANTGKVDPKGPSTGTAGGENKSSKDGKSANAEDFTEAGSDSPRDDGRNAQNWQKENLPGPVDALSGAQHPNAGDIQTSRGNMRTGSDAHGGVGAGDPGGHFSYRCSDAGNADCRWETSMASSDQLWNEIQQHHRDVHGKPSLDEVTRGRIQDAIHSRRAA